MIIKVFLEKKDLKWRNREISVKCKDQGIPDKENYTRKRPEERMNEVLQSTMETWTCLELKMF